MGTTPSIVILAFYPPQSKHVHDLVSPTLLLRHFFTANQVPVGCSKYQKLPLALGPFEFLQSTKETHQLRRQEREMGMATDVQPPVLAGRGGWHGPREAVNRAPAHLEVTMEGCIAFNTTVACNPAVKSIIYCSNSEFFSWKSAENKISTRQACFTKPPCLYRYLQIGVTSTQRGYFISNWPLDIHKRKGVALSYCCLSSVLKTSGLSPHRVQTLHLARRLLPPPTTSSPDKARLSTDDHYLPLPIRSSRPLQHCPINTVPVPQFLLAISMETIFFFKNRVTYSQPVVHTVIRDSQI